MRLVLSQILGTANGEGVGGVAGPVKKILAITNHIRLGRDDIFILLSSRDRKWCILIAIHKITSGIFSQ